MNLSKQTIQYVAKILAGLYPYNTPEGPCSCDAPSCRRFGCVLFWEAMIDRPEVLANALELYEDAKELIL